MRRRLKGDYQEVNAPQMLDKSLWETSGHWGWFRENMFTAQSAGDETEDERVFAIKPMNCPGHVQIFKHGLKSLPRPAAAAGRVRRRAPLRAVGRAARADARARLHAGRRAHLLHRGADGRRVPEDQRPDPLDLCATSASTEIVVKLSTRPEKRVGTDALWDHAEGVMTRRAEADRGAVGRRDQDRRSTRARARSTGRSSSTCCATPSAATGSAAPRRSTSTCRSGSARSTSTPTARRRRR